MGLKKTLGLVLAFAALTAAAQGQTSVTLAWNPCAGTNIASYKLYYGVASRTYTSTNNVGNLTNATISSLISGATYYFAATAVDTSGLESAYSAEVVFTNLAATLPTIVLSSPVSGASYTAPATIGLAATVTANGHTITQVQFYSGTTLFGTVAAAPYSFSWNTVSAGTYSLSAKAVYDSGSTVASTPANVTVTTVPLPSIVLSAPVNGASYAAPASVNLAATVTANGHTITKVQFYNGATLLAEDTSAPYSFAWTNVSAGTCSLSAKAVYDSGSTIASTAANVTVTNVPLPSVALTTPANGASYAAPASISMAATVTANGHTITKVQFYNGSTLLAEDASAPYSLVWTNVNAGSYSLSAKAVYDSGSTVTCVPVNVTCVNATSVATIWPSTAVPGTVDDGPDSAVELGVRFRADVAGSITGIRFYKATANTGTHLGHLWNSTGTLLASATFAGESASGWQQVNFLTPVAIAANTVYVASYYSPIGHYSADVGYFSSKGVDTPPLHALTNGVSGGNGVYAYGASSAFPNLTWSAANYWVDLMFQPGAAATLTSIVVTPANPTLLLGATQQFTATGTYSDSSTQNVTSQATWSSSSTAVATVSATGLATAVSAGTTTLSAALNGVTGSSAPSVIVNPPTIALTAPLNGASYTAPATINLTAGVTANGHTITKVQFYSGVTLIGQVSTAPYTLTWTNVSAGSYSLSASLVYDAGSTLASSPVSIAVTGLPAPWQTTDIGSVGVAGSASVSNGLYTVKGAGNISGTADNFRFVYQPLSGDGEIKVRLNSVGTNATNSCIGVMIRESITAGSRYSFMGVGQTVKFRWQRRSTTAGSTSTTTSVLGTTPNVWARLTRVGNTLTGYQSIDGTNWTQVSSRSITMATNIYVGLAVASGSSNTLNTATFTSMTVVP